jgi:BlaI family penicillinase repressor
VSDHLPTDRELELLKVLWTHGEATVREVAEVMNSGGADLAYTTVLTLLQIMETKQMVSHRKVGKAYVYAATVERDDTFQDMAKGFLAKVFDGSLEEYVRGVLDAQPASADELDRLSEMVESKKLDARKRPPGEGGRRQ